MHPHGRERQEDARSGLEFRAADDRVIGLILHHD
jgi:hypothetical protein